jgi:phytoene desaturase
MYDEKYWNKKVMAPSALLFYVGIDKKMKNVLHHTLFFDVPFDDHAKEIYDTPSWPKEPLFYASFPSITDDSIAPKGKEAAIFLIPLAPDLEDTPELRETYFEIIIKRLEQLTKQEIGSSILFKESYCVQDFKDDYHSYKGNAYGMANTLLQTAFLRPKIRSRKLKNLYFTGQLTVPGPGVPPSLISGKLVSELLIKDENK